MIDPTKPLAVPLLGKTDVIDFVTVTFSAELRLLQLQARSLALFLPPGLVGTINIIVNEASPDEVLETIRKNVLPLYGALADRVRLWTRQDMTGDYEFVHSGWYSQQILKLLISRHLTANGYIILDTKNHFIRPLNRADFVADDGRLKHRRRNLLVDQQGKLGRWFSKKFPGRALGQLLGRFSSGNSSDFPKRFVGTFRYFGLDPSDHASMVVPRTTPFPVYRAFAEKLIDLVEAKEAQPFAAWFETYFDATEFYLLQAFPASLGLKYTDYYAVSRAGAKVIYPDRKKTIATLISQLSLLEDRRFFSFGVHRASTGVIGPEARQALMDFWQHRDLVAPHEDIEYFFAQGEPKPLQYTSTN